MPLSDVARRLAQLDLFAELTDDELLAIAAVGEARELSADSPLFVEGAPGDAMYLVLAGTLRMQRDGAGGQRTVTQGDAVDLDAIVEGRPRTHSVYGAEPCSLLRFDRDAVLASLSPRAVGAVLRSLAERHRSEAQMQHSTLEMVASVAHDINTPLGIINQAASIIEDALRGARCEALAKDEDALATLSDIKDAAALIARGAGRARELVLQFRDAAVRELDVRLETVPLDELVRDIVALYRFAARERKLAIAVGTLPDGANRWCGYPGYLSRILLNLLSNVDRYAYPDGAGGEVRIDLGRDGDDFVITVIDRGAGMSDQQLATLFTPFVTTGRAIGGTGLGMPGVRRLVTSALEGTIHVDSALGQGTRVELRLPPSIQQRTKTESMS